MEQVQLLVSFYGGTGEEKHGEVKQLAQGHNREEWIQSLYPDI